MGGYTPLHIAAMYGRTDIINRLLQVHNIRIDLKSRSDETAVDLAIEGGHANAAKLLLCNPLTLDTIRKDFIIDYTPQSESMRDIAGEVI